MLAYLHGEPGQELVASFRGSAVLSPVNLAEVVSKLLDGGMSEDDARDALAELELQVGSDDVFLGWRAGALRPLTRHLGLSLGDRFALALAMDLDLPVLTADRAWARVELPVTIALIR